MKEGRPGIESQVGASEILRSSAQHCCSLEAAVEVKRLQQDLHHGEYNTCKHAVTIENGDYREFLIQYYMTRTSGSGLVFSRYCSTIFNRLSMA